MGEKPLFMKRKSKASCILAGVFVVFLIAGFLSYVLNSDTAPGGVHIGRIIKTPAGEQIFKNKDNLVILVIGLDENRDEKGILHHKGSRTDTIFLLGVDKKADRLSLISVPRDTWVHLGDKYGDGRINTAYTNAFWEEFEKSGNDYQKSKTAGIKEAKRIIGNFLGVEIDHYVLLKIQAAEQFVDAIDGIVIDVEKDMDYDDNWGNLHIHLKEGRHRLMGADVVGYARFRHDEEGDWGRIRRQQQVVKALVNELKKPNHIMHINRIAKVIKENIETDLDINQLIDLARVYQDFDRNNVIKGVIAGEDEIIEDNMVILPNDVVKERLVNRILKNPGRIGSEEIWVRILNGCGVAGLGNKTDEKIRPVGYNIVEVTNAEEQNYEKTVIIDHYINPAGAGKLKEVIGAPNAEIIHREVDECNLTLDFTIILGRDMVEDESSSDGSGSDVSP